MRPLFRAESGKWERILGLALLAILSIAALPRLYESQPYIWLPNAGRIPVESTRACDPLAPGVRAAYVLIFSIGEQVVARCSVVLEPRLKSS